MNIQAVNTTDFRIDIYGSKKRILSAIKGIDKQIEKNHGGKGKSGDVEEVANTTR